jgi:DNA-binding GntR family transcriptional regulator
LASSTPPKSTYVPQRSLNKATLSERVYETLREDILSNRLPPGSPLLEISLSNAFEVGRSSVREAILRLAAEGLVVLAPRRGAVVSSLSKEEFLDCYRVREALEVLAMRLATPNFSTDDLQVLESLHNAMREAADGEDVDAFFTTNTAFHTLIVDRSGNQKLQEIYHPLINQMRRYSLSSLKLRGGLRRSCEEHQEILAAIHKGEADEAAHLLSEHIRVPQYILESDERAELLPRAYTPTESDGRGHSSAMGESQT